MSFVGIISKNEDYVYIKRELIKDNKNKIIELININKNNIQNIKNVKFQTVIFNDELIDMKSQKKDINKIISSSKYLIINTDNNIKNLNIRDNKIQIITYGMNPKSTVTISSVKEDEILICLQRSIETISGKVIEMQEFKKKIDKITDIKMYNLLVLFILEELYK